MASSDSSAPTEVFEFPEKLRGLFGDKRYFVAYGGRGGVKSWSFARAALLQGAEKPMRFLCAREVQKSIRDSVHQLLKDQIDLLGLDRFYQVRNTEITAPNGTRFMFSGLSDQTTASLKSYEGIDICWVEEAQAVTRRSWDILVPTIRKPGSRIWVSFNPELDTDETWTRFVESPPDDADVVFVNYRDNPWFPEVLEQERQEFERQVEIGARDRDDYDNIWEGMCRAAVPGAIYAREIGDLKREGRYCPIEPDPRLLTHTVWDLGWNDLMVVGMWQRSPHGLLLIDSIIRSHTRYSDIVAELKERKYRWGRDFLPHDAKHANPQTGQGSDRILGDLGLNVAEVPKTGIEAGIKAVRQEFRKIWIADGRGDNAQVINALQRYRRQINQTTNEPMGPMHDEASHPADMVRYAVLSADQMSNEESDRDFNKAFRNKWAFG